MSGDIHRGDGPSLSRCLNACGVTEWGFVQYTVVLARAELPGIGLGGSLDSLDSLDLLDSLSSLGGGKARLGFPKAVNALGRFGTLGPAMRGRRGRANSLNADLSDSVHRAQSRAGDTRTRLEIGLLVLTSSQSRICGLIRDGFQRNNRVHLHKPANRVRHLRIYNTLRRDFAHLPSISLVHSRRPFR